MAKPMTLRASVSLVALERFWRGNATYLCDICCDDGNLCKEIQQVIKPRWQEGATGLRKIEPADGAELDGEALEEDGKDVGEQDDKEQAEAVGGPGGDVGGVVARVNVGD